MPELTGANPAEDWRNHVECHWTWPNTYGVIGCQEHLVVFMPPSGDDAWTSTGPTYTLWSRP